MKTGERQTTDSVDVWRTADDLPLFGMHVEVDGTSWTCGAVRSWDVDVWPTSWSAAGVASDVM